MSNVTLPIEVVQHMVTYIEKSSELLGEQAKIASAVAQRSPGVVDVLIQAGMLPAEKRATAIPNMQDQLKVMESLRKAAMATMQLKQASVAPAPMGKPEPTASAKQAGSKTKSEADRKFLEAFGFAS